MVSIFLQELCLGKAIGCFCTNGRALALRFDPAYNEPMVAEELTLTWGPLTPPCAAPPHRLSHRRHEDPFPASAPYGRISGTLLLNGILYQWDFPLLNPYVPVEEGVEQDALRKWRIAVVRDLIRQRCTDKRAIRTVRSWADLSWKKLARCLRGLEPAQRDRYSNPLGTRHRRYALLTSYLCLCNPLGTPEAFAGGVHKRPGWNRDIYRRVPCPREHVVYLPLSPKRIYHPETGASVCVPATLSIPEYQAAFPADRVPGVREKGRRPGRLAPDLSYRGLWRESAVRSRAGRKGGRPKQKACPAEAEQALSGR